MLGFILFASFEAYKFHSLCTWVHMCYRLQLVKLRALSQVSTDMERQVRWAFGNFTNLLYLDLQISWTSPKRPFRFAFIWFTTQHRTMFWDHFSCHIFTSEPQNCHDKKENDSWLGFRWAYSLLLCGHTSQSYSRPHIDHGCWWKACTSLHSHGNQVFWRGKRCEPSTKTKISQINNM